MQAAKPRAVPNSKTLPPADLHAAIDRLATSIAHRHPRTPRLLLLGIANGGIELARRLAVLLVRLRPACNVTVGTLDISFHRDDIGRNPIPKEFVPTLIPVDVTGASVIMVDDVLFSGRTVKAALDELFDHGRPARVELAIMIDRGGRMLPFAPDYLGLSLPAGETEKVRVYLDPNDPSADHVTVVPSSAPRPPSP
jgi:pyrimidine operon attenuation protein/uracil phosphoribosyltransferase